MLLKNNEVAKQLSCIRDCGAIIMILFYLSFLPEFTLSSRRAIRAVRNDKGEIYPLSKVPFLSEKWQVMKINEKLM